MSRSKGTGKAPAHGREPQHDWDDDADDDDWGGSLGGSFSVDGVDISFDDDGGSRSAEPAEDDGRVRLQKALANAGVASRRASESLITRGRVTVNGEGVQELGSRIDPEADEIAVDGVAVQLDVTKRYFILNKPRGVVSTMSDEQGRPDLREFTDEFEERLYNVGRLDTDTSGLLILTNDGDLAHVLAHPKFGVQKTYVAKVRGRIAPATVQQLKTGVELEDGVIVCDAARVLPGGQNATDSLIEVTLHSGKNRIVRRMLAAVGHPVQELVRRQFGPLTLGAMRVGDLRELRAEERGELLTLVRNEGKAAKAPAGTPRPRPRQVVKKTGEKKQSAGRAATGQSRAERLGRAGRERSEDQKQQNRRAEKSGERTPSKNRGQQNARSAAPRKQDPR